MEFSLSSLSISKSEDYNALAPKIKVIGVGGAGNNAINNMINDKFVGAEFIVANTDAQDLQDSLVPPEKRIQLGRNRTKGLGAGSIPEVGKQAAEESINEIAELITDSNMLFITAGMGGGTGTGAAPVIARIAKEHKILTIAVITKPFNFEGRNRMKVAESGLRELQKYVDTYIVIPNQNLFRIATEKTTLKAAFKLADDVLYAGVSGITDLITKPGMINLDFADIETVMKEMGRAMMGTGEASGENRAIKAAEIAISNPLLDNINIDMAKGLLINVTGGIDMTLFEVDAAVNCIRERTREDVNIIFGSAIDESMAGSIRVSVVATGITDSTLNDVQRVSDFKEQARKEQKEKVFVSHDGSHINISTKQDHSINNIIDTNEGKNFADSAIDYSIPAFLRRNDKK